MKGISGSKYGFPIVWPVFLEASSFHSDTHVHHSLTFTFRGDMNSRRKDSMLIYLPINCPRNLKLKGNGF